MSKMNALKIINKIKNQARKSKESYNTGLVGEHIIIASYESMTIDKLEKIRYILNKIIKKKKEYKYINKSKK